MQLSLLLMRLMVGHMGQITCFNGQYLFSGKWISNFVYLGKYIILGIHDQNLQ